MIELAFHAKEFMQALIGTEVGIFMNFDGYGICALAAQKDEQYQPLADAYGSPALNQNVTELIKIHDDDPRYRVLTRLKVCKSVIESGKEELDSSGITFLPVINDKKQCVSILTTSSADNEKTEELKRISTVLHSAITEIIKKPFGFENDETQLGNFL